MDRPELLWILFASSTLAALALGVGLWQAFRRWYVSVDPDEFVVHYRAGRVRQVGRGLSFFCLPWDTYLRVPSTIRDVNFAADQITEEKQGVRVQGFLAYRIADFELAYQSLDLKSRSIRLLKSCEDAVRATDHRERNCEQVIDLDPHDPLAKTDVVLRRLAESVVRHEVSNKSVDEMMTERESVIRSMRTQLQETVQHWGIEIDTIEFTEVWIRSRELFENLQAEYRDQMRLRSARSTTTTDREISEGRLRAEREVAVMGAENERLRRIKASEELRAARTAEIADKAQVDELDIHENARLERMRLEEAQAKERLAREREAELRRREQELAEAEELARLAEAHEREQEAHRVELDRRSKVRELREREIESERRTEELKSQAAIAAMELEGEHRRLVADLRLAELRAELARRRAQVEQEATDTERRALAERRRAEELAEGKLAEGRADAESLRLRTEAENQVGPEALRKVFLETLPRIAESIKVDDLRWIQLGGDDGASPLDLIPRTLAKTLATFQGMGVDLGGLLGEAPAQEAEPDDGEPDVPPAGVEEPPEGAEA